MYNKRKGRKTTIEKIQKKVPEQKELYNENLKNKVYELFESFLSSEEIEKARELFQLVVKFFPDEKKFNVAINIIAPSKVVSSKKSETEGIQETTQFLKNLGILLCQSTKSRRVVLLVPLKPKLLILKNCCPTLGTNWGYRLY